MKKLTFQNIDISNKRDHKQSGFSLIEIMVAALILSIGILGVAGLQMVGMKGTHQSFMKQQASDLVNNLTERMRSNKQGVIDGDYLLANVNDTANVNCSNAVPNCSTLSCSSSDVALSDLHNTVCGFKAGASSNYTGGVKMTNANDLAIFSDGDLSITCPNGCNVGDIRIQVQWSEREFGKETNEDNAGNKILDSLIVNTRILP